MGLLGGGALVGSVGNSTSSRDDTTESGQSGPAVCIAMSMTDRECSRTITTISDSTKVSPLKDVTHGDEARRWSYARPTAPVRTFRRTIAHVWSGSLDRYSIRVVVFVV